MSKTKIQQKIEALLKKGARLQKIAAAIPLNDVEGLSQPELAVLASLAGDAALPDSTTTLYSLQRDVEGAGFTSVGFGLGLRRLLGKNLIVSLQDTDYNGEEHPVAKLTDAGWAWIEENEAMFALKKASPPKAGFDDDDIPF